jgi:hypothetical protein
MAPSVGAESIWAGVGSEIGRVWGRRTQTEVDLQAVEAAAASAAFLANFPTVDDVLKPAHNQTTVAASNKIVVDRCLSPALCMRGGDDVFSRPNPNCNAGQRYRVCSSAS